MNRSTVPTWKRVCTVVLSAWSTAAIPHGQERIVIAGRTVDVWRPSATSGRQPVILFSHGGGGCAGQSRFLTEALARAGYWVVAPNHADHQCEGQRSGRRSGQSRARSPRGSRSRDAAPSVFEPDAWNDTTHANRAADLREIQAALPSHPTLSPHIDVTRLGYAGHSLGGYTTVGLAGGWPSWKLPGVRAVLAMSPYVHPFDDDGTLGTIGVPIMYQGGTKDQITPFLKRPGGAYAQSTDPKYFVELEGAGHFAWTNLETGWHSAILAYAIPFFDRYVKGLDAPFPATLASEVATWWYSSELGQGGGNTARQRRR